MTAANALTPITDKVSKLIRLLSSDNDGEVLAAARALRRTLQTSGADLHTLAAAIELSDAVKLGLYKAGFEDDKRATEDAQPVSFHSVDGASNWHEMALWCQQHSNRLRTNECEFINDMASRTVWREPTEKQGKWVKSIYLRRGGKL
jgi:hypothetical protein